MKKAWIASITLFFTISVLVFSSQTAYAGQAPEFAIKCYLLTDGNPPANPLPLPFSDQFQAKMIDPDGDTRYCVEALKHSDTGPLNPRYWVQHEDAPVALNDLLTNPNGITITDQFLGKFTANLMHFDLLIPASVSSNVLLAGPVNTNYYSGYFPSVLQSSMQLPTVPAVMVSDQFATSLITLQPEDENAFEATAIVGGQGTPGVDLMCYMYENNDETQITGNIDPTPAQVASVWTTQFAPNGVTVIDLEQGDVLCVTAMKMEPTTPPPTPTVGGEFLPIETTALLIAAVQSPAAWLTSLTIAVLGIGAYVFTRNPNNMRNIKVILRDYLDRL